MMMVMMVMMKMMIFKVKEGRDVWPNKGFLQQLIDWENECNRFLLAPHVLISNTCSYKHHRFLLAPQVLISTIGSFLHHRPVIISEVLHASLMPFFLPHVMIFS